MDTRRNIPLATRGEHEGIVQEAWDIVQVVQGAVEKAGMEGKEKPQANRGRRLNKEPRRW